MVGESQYDCADGAVKAVRMDDMTYMEVQEIDMHPLVSLSHRFLYVFTVLHHLCLAI